MEQKPVNAFPFKAKFKGVRVCDFVFMIMRPKMLCRLNKKHHELENLLKHNHMI